MEVLLGKMVHRGDIEPCMVVVFCDTNGGGSWRLESKNPYIAHPTYTIGRTVIELDGKKPTELSIGISRLLWEVLILDGFYPV